MYYIKRAKIGPDGKPVKGSKEKRILGQLSINARAKTSTKNRKMKVTLPKFGGQ